jgi:hypothetical protein
MCSSYFFRTKLYHLLYIYFKQKIRFFKIKTINVYLVSINL